MFLQFFFLISIVFCAEFSFASSIYYCKDMQPQSHVDIEQLLGMWYGIEIIQHTKSEESVSDQRTEYSCPGLTFSEADFFTTQNPLHSDYNYNERYGGRYGWNSGMYKPTEQPNDGKRQDHKNFYQRAKYGQVTDEDKMRNNKDIRRLKIFWNEHGIDAEYFVRYNKTQAGTWIASGPQNGSALESKFNDFAGTIQVLKAVGNHLVLLFCQQLPDKDLFTILLSRTPTLSQTDVHGVHDLLGRRNLELYSIRKVCTTNSAPNIQNSLVFMILGIWSIIALGII